MTQTLVGFIKDYALKHYEGGGWDVVVECFTDAEIADTIGDAKNTTEALASFEYMVEVWSDRQADARIEGAI